jgi:hypothetical protein
MVSFGGQVPKLIILRYEVIWHLKLGFLRFNMCEVSKYFEFGFLSISLAIAFPSLLLFHKIS